MKLAIAGGSVDPTTTFALKLDEDGDVQILANNTLVAYVKSRDGSLELCACSTREIRECGLAMDDGFWKVQR